MSTCPALEERIKAAFADNRYPGDDHLAVYLRRGRKVDKTFQLLRSKTWQELPVPQFMSLDTPIPDLAPEAFHYYMPALLIGALNEWADLSVALTYYFTPSSHELLALQDHGDPHNCRDWFKKRVALFSAVQRTVIVDVLREFVRRGWEDEASVREALAFLERSDKTSVG